MKIEEAKEAIKRDLADVVIEQSGILNILDQIEPDQPKPVVPQFVIDWVNNSREADYEFEEWFYYSNQPSVVYEWVNSENKRQSELNALALMTLIVNGPDAVTVEKEKLYTVEILGNKLYKLTSDNHARYMLLPKDEPLPMSREYKFSDQLTESDVKASDERLLQWVKEVTE
ncbi:DUF1642 domain-containing protein [Streptococcus uberis]|uniref:DUF1642 domain-containing protein n=1 Tax=Streptococcus uberis TaxID=1349 RepID=UPI00214FA9E6|nr:DUF1642 domain-containing protein [Streptococcus uberis]MCR4256905.1 DUF1642 domain-containing protein [Streptococcus uberis]